MVKVGDTVFHPKYGYGAVKFITEYSAGKYCDVLFDSGSFIKLVPADLEIC